MHLCKMEKIKLTKNFYLHEFIDKNTYLEYERKDKLQLLVYKLDWRIIEGLQLLRDNLSKEYKKDIPLFVNNWAYGLNRQYSGLRFPGKPYYSEGSQHSYGRAVDVVSIITSEKIRQHILKNKNTYLLYFNRLEDKVSWTHIDNGWDNDINKITLFAA